MHGTQADPGGYRQLLEIAQRRRSRRAFLDVPVSDETIENILAVAATSPYASGKQNWEITVLRDRETLTRMAEAVAGRCLSIARQVDQDYVDGFREYASNFLFFEHAPAVLVLSYRMQKSLSLMLRPEQGSVVRDTVTAMPDGGAALAAEIAVWERDSYVKSISCVAMLVLLAAESLGLGACYMTGPLIAEKELASLLGLKKGRSIGAIIPIGYHDTGGTPEKKTEREQPGSTT